MNNVMGKKLSGMFQQSRDERLRSRRLCLNGWRASDSARAISSMDHP
jgi:hypothetical protein